jgi:hypothetical protein
MMRSNQLFRAGISILAMILWGCGSSNGPDDGGDGGCITIPANLPSAIAAPATVHPVLQVFASGTQDYVCEATDAGTFAWTFIAPEAILYQCDSSGAEVGRHFAGPTWHWNADGSELVGNGATAAKAASPDDPVNDIPWLLLPKKSASASGYFSAFVYTQRVNTVGGAAPSTGCGASSVGADAGVPYHSNYIFYENN